MYNRHSLFIAVLWFVFALVVVVLIFRRGISHVSKAVSAELDQVLHEKTITSVQACDKLLQKMERSKTIADHALASDVHIVGLRQAINEIFIILSETSP